MAPRYEPKVYRKQGGDELVVASGGILSAGSSAVIDANGRLNAPAGFRHTVENKGTTSLALSAVGVSFLDTTATVDYALPAITAGMPGLEKRCIKTNATTTLIAYVSQPTSAVFFVGGYDRIALATLYETASFIAGTTVEGKWFVSGFSGTTAAYAAST